MRPEILSNIQRHTPGFYSSDFGPSVLSELGFTMPNVQTFPETAAGLASALGQPTALASHIFPLQETATNYADVVGAGSLVVSGGLQGQICPAWNGSSWTSRKAFESTIISDKAQNIGDTTLFDQTTGSFAIIGAFRCNTASSNGSIIGKRNGSAGWSINATGTDGVSFKLNDGVITPQASEFGASVKDGSLQGFICIVNTTTGWMHLITERGVTSTDISALGSLSTAAPFAIGQQDGYAAGANYTQVTWVALIEGAAAEALDQAAFDSWWEHAKNSDLTTVSRNCPITAKVADGYYAHFAPDTVAIAHNENFTNAAKRGLRCNSAKVNEVPYSEISTGATNSSVTPTDFAANAPDGFRSATTLLSTAPAGYQEKICTVLASTQYTGSIVIKESTAGVQGRVAAYDLSNGAEIGATAYTATGTSQEVAYVFTTPVGCISVGLRCEITNNAEAVIAWGWCLNTGDGRVYVRNNGSPTALVASVLEDSSLPVNLPKGELRATAVQNCSSGVSSYIYDRDTTYLDQRQCYLAANNRVQAAIRSGATTEDSIGSLSVYLRDSELPIRHLWDAQDESLGYESIMYSEGVRRNGAVLPYDYIHIGTYSGIAIGCSYSGLSQFDGDIQSIESYDGPLTL